MRIPLIAAVALALGMGLSGCVVLNGAETKANELTPEEKKAGWQLLFDGRTTQGWRSFKKSAFPSKGWVVEDGWLKCLERGGGGDIVSEGKFEEFELEWEWRLPRGGNNGLKYFITEERSSAIGHEYQMIDDSLVKNSPKGLTASFYDVLPPAKKTPLKPNGEINHSRVVVRGQTVEHWLNGEKVLQYELGSSEVLEAVARSKFKDVGGFGKRLRGHILLTDHRDEAWYRNIKIRELQRKP